MKTGSRGKSRRNFNIFLELSENENGQKRMRHSEAVIRGKCLSLSDHINILRDLI